MTRLSRSRQRAPALRGAVSHRGFIAVAFAAALALLVASVGLAGGDPPSPGAANAEHGAAVALALETATATPSPLPTPPPGSGGSATSPGGAGLALPTPTPSPVPTPTPTPLPTITPPPRPATVDAPVPSSVRSILSNVPNDIPKPFFDGCHVWLGGVMPAKSCLYGNLSSHTTIAIYGDSHALAWFPAVMRVVSDRGWRLLNVTMAGCTPADITPADGYGRVLTACINFRKAAIAKLTKYHPTVILVTGTRGFATVDKTGHLLTGAARTSAWIAGMGRTVGKLIPITRRVALIADTPNSRFADPPGCLAKNLAHAIACATPVAHALSYTWINNEYRVALTKAVAFIDAERWVCPTSPCPLVRGSFVVHRDHGHMTGRFAASQWRRMEAAIDRVLADPRAVIGP